MGLLERVNKRGRSEERFAVDDWLSNYLIPAVEQFVYNGAAYPYGLNQTYGRSRIEQVAATLPGYSAALAACPPAFAAQMVRALVISGARFTWRNLPSSSTPRRTFGNQDLAPLESPWPKANTGTLLKIMEWHAGVAGASFVTTRSRSRLRVLRPDWTYPLYGSENEPDDAETAIDGELIGYVYQNGGLASAHKPITLLPDEVAHWMPNPDPLRPWMGMSWITPAIREIQGDRAATAHKLKFFENGATPNLVVKGIQAPPGEELTQESFKKIVDMLDSQHAGIRNAYRTLYLTAGADASVVGSDLQQIDFKATQGAGETRIAMLSRVHPVILAASEGLSGSSLNAGNFGMARRIWADTWVYPTLADACRALADLLRVPGDAELWYDPTDIPILREDAKDMAQISEIEAATIGQLVRDGFVPESAVAAVRGHDMSLLKHTGLVSVQLIPPGTVAANVNKPGTEPTSPASGK